MQKISKKDKSYLDLKSYNDATRLIAKKHNNHCTISFPTIDDGVKGIEFIFAAKESSKHNARWIKINN